MGLWVGLTTFLSWTSVNHSQHSLDPPLMSKVYVGSLILKGNSWLRQHTKWLGREKLTKKSKAVPRIWKTSSILGKHKDLWHMIWNLKVQLKVRIFIWRLYHDIIPTVRRLQQKGIVIKGVCYLCVVEQETSSYLMSQCSYTLAALDVASSNFKDAMRKGNGILHTIKEALHTTQKDQREKLVSVLYNVWFRTNQVWNGKRALLIGSFVSVTQYRQVHWANQIIE